MDKPLHKRIENYSKRRKNKQIKALQNNTNFPLHMINEILKYNEYGLKPYGDFPGIDLTGAILNDLDLTGINLQNANLTGARLWNTNLTDANLLDAKLYGASISRDSNLLNTKVRWKDLSECVGFVNSDGNYDGNLYVHYFKINPHYRG